MSLNVCSTAQTSKSAESLVHGWSIPASKQAPKISVMVDIPHTVSDYDSAELHDDSHRSEVADSGCTKRVACSEQ